MKRQFTICSMLMLMAASALGQLTNPYAVQVSPVNGQIVAPGGTKLFDSNAPSIKSAIGFYNGTNWTNFNASTAFSGGIMPEARSAHNMTNMGLYGTTVFDPFGGYNFLNIDGTPGTMSLHLTAQQGKITLEPSTGVEVKGGVPIWGSGSGLSNLNLSATPSGQVPAANLNNAILSTNGAGTNATFYGSTGTYGANKFSAFSTTGPSFDVFSGFLRWFGGSSGYQWFDSSGTTKLMEIGTDKILRSKAPIYWVPTAVISPTAEVMQQVGETSYSPFVGGSGSPLADLPVPPQAIWRRQPLPPFFITTWFATNGNANNANETFITNQIKVMNTNYVPWLSQVGVRPMLDINGGWMYNPGTSQTANRDANGRFWWNTNKIQDGMPFICTFGYTNGVDIEAMVYYDSREPSPNEGTSYFGAISTPSYVPTDVDQFMRWGMKGFRIADSTQRGYYLQMLRQFDDAILHPRQEPIAEGTNGLQVSSVLYSNSMAVYAGVTGFPVLPEFAFAANCLIPDQPSTGGGDGNDISEAMYEGRVVETNVIWQIGKGHWNSGQVIPDNPSNQGNAQGFWGMGAMQMWPFQGGYNFVPTATFMQTFTNVELLKIWADPLGEPSVVIYDLGKSNVSCRARALWNGDYAILLANETGASQTMGFNVNQINSTNTFWPPVGYALQWAMDTNSNWAVYDVFAKAAVSNAFLTCTQTLSAHTLKLYRLSPLARQCSKIVTADVARVNNTVTDDATLTFPIGAYESWDFEFIMKYTTTATTPNFYFQLNGPASPAALFYTQELYDGSGGLNAGGPTVLRTAYQVANAGPGAAQTGYARTHGRVVNGSTAGNITIQWSQQTTDGSHATSLLAGSTLVATRLK